MLNRNGALGRSKDLDEYHTNEAFARAGMLIVENQHIKTAENMALFYQSHR